MWKTCKTYSLLKAEIFQVMICKDLRESYTSRRNSIFYAWRSMLWASSSYQMFTRRRCMLDPESGSLRFSLVLQNTPVQQNVITSLSRKSIT